MKICPHHLHFFLISMLLLILFSVYFSIFVSVRLTTSHCVSNLYYLVGEKQGFYKRVTNTVQKWAEKDFPTMNIAEWAKIKGAQNERLTNQWWLMLIVCKYILLADAAYYTDWLSILYDLKDGRLKKLLVFLPKIEDLTLLTLICLQAEGKREKMALFCSETSGSRR